VLNRQVWHDALNYLGLDGLLRVLEGVGLSPAVEEAISKAIAENLQVVVARQYTDRKDYTQLVENDPTVEKEVSDLYKAIGARAEILRETAKPEDLPPIKEPIPIEEPAPVETPVTKP